MKFYDTGVICHHKILGFTLQNRWRAHVIAETHRNVWAKYLYVYSSSNMDAHVCIRRHDITCLYIHRISRALALNTY